MATERAAEEQNLQAQEEVKDEHVEQEETEDEISVIEMTEEELEDKIKRESDRKVSKKLKELQAQHKKDLEKKTAEARKEAEELAKLSEAERLKVEKEREEMKLSKEREEFERERSEFEKERLKLQAEKELAIRKLPTEFAGYILGDDADDTFERITVLEEQWQKALEAEINERLKSKTPKLGMKNKKSHFTRDQVDNMSQEEVAANLAEIEESMKSW